MATRLRRVTATAGYLEHCEITFAEGLTCIIGARGTCKSTILETIRFALNCDPERVGTLIAEHHGEGQPGSAVGMVRATLKGGTVTCEINSGDARYAVERDIGSPPRYYHEGVREHAPDAGAELPIEIYSQGDLQRVADDEDLRLTLIDRPNKARIRKLKEQRAEELERLREIGPELKKIRISIDAKRNAIKSLDSLRIELQQLRASRPELPAELDDERNAFLKRKTLLELAHAAVTQRGQVLEAVASVTRQIPHVVSGHSALASSELPEAAEISKLLARTATFVEHVHQAVEAELNDPTNATVHAFAKSIEAKNEKYYQLRKEQASINELLKKEDALRQQIERLEKTSQEFDFLLEDERALLAQRQEARNVSVALTEEIFKLRMMEVDAINMAHSDTVVLTLRHGGRSSEYSTRISKLLAGSRLRNQEEVAREVASLVLPADLVDIVETGDSKRLARILDRDQAQVTRLIAYLSDHPGLYDLEGVVFEDQLDITMYDGDTPKAVSGLSKGQKATALLPLILRTAEYPLVMDQPEDDLDNRFVYSTLVERIRSLKSDRQLIFVTHNANIPVLGEADQIVVMRMDTPVSAAAPIVGTVEERKGDILNILEGGADAFRRRHEKYSALLVPEHTDSGQVSDD
ncbi:MAG: hypothetical protein HUU21_18620 [Polyangiaceae bacterium]|nr:hypothetical protein [Polyangiaceae bacterium]